MDITDIQMNNMYSDQIEYMGPIESSLFEEMSFSTNGVIPKKIKLIPIRALIFHQFNRITGFGYSRIKINNVIPKREDTPIAALAQNSFPVVTLCIKKLL